MSNSPRTVSQWCVTFVRAVSHPRNELYADLSRFLGAHRGNGRQSASLLPYAEEVQGAGQVQVGLVPKLVFWGLPHTSLCTMQAVPGSKRQIHLPRRRRSKTRPRRPTISLMMTISSPPPKRSRNCSRSGTVLVTSNCAIAPSSTRLYQVSSSSFSLLSRYLSQMLCVLQTLSRR